MEKQRDVYKVIHRTAQKHCTFLRRIQDDTTFDDKQRSDAAGLLLSINTEQFLATLYWFHEVFGRYTSTWKQLPHTFV